MRLIQFLLILSIVSCSTVHKLSLRTMTPVLKKGGDYLTYERNWDFFKQSTPSNLKFLEILYLQDPSNLDLLELLIKGYSGFAFAVPETLLIEDQLKGNDDSRWKMEAIDFYTRAFDYGLTYLEKRDIKNNQLLELNDKNLLDLLKEELSEKDVTALLYFAQAWGSLINLQKDNIALVAQVPKVKTIFDWVCELKPDVDDGVCEIFYAQYEASRPKMLGGDPVRAEKLYQEAIAKRPHHLLIRLGYIQYLILPSYDEEKYNLVSSQMMEEFEKWENYNREFLKSQSDYSKSQQLNLYNAIAKKRLQIIEKYKKDIF